MIGGQEKLKVGHGRIEGTIERTQHGPPTVQHFSSRLIGKVFPGNNHILMSREKNEWIMNFRRKFEFLELRSRRTSGYFDDELFLCWLRKKFNCSDFHS